MKAIFLFVMTASVAALAQTSSSASSSQSEGMSSCLVCNTTVQETAANGRVSVRLPEAVSEILKAQADDEKWGKLEEVGEKDFVVLTCNRDYTLDQAEKDFQKLQEQELHYEGTNEEFYLNRLRSQYERDAMRTLKNCYRKSFKVAFEKYQRGVKYYLKSIREASVANQANDDLKSDDSGKKKSGGLDFLDGVTDIFNDVDPKLSYTAHGGLRVGVSKDAWSGELKAQVASKEQVLGYSRRLDKNTRVSVEAYCKDGRKGKGVYSSLEPKDDCGVKARLRRDANIF